MLKTERDVGRIAFFLKDSSFTYCRVAFYVCIFVPQHVVKNFLGPTSETFSRDLNVRFKKGFQLYI
jgi:hypothetical protein